MCSKPPKMPTPPPAPDPIATPTYADAAVQKAGQTVRDKNQSTVNRHVKSTALGVQEEAETKKFGLGVSPFEDTNKKKAKLGE